MYMKRGEMYLVDFNLGVGSEQSGIRPAVIIQNNVGNRHSRTVIVAIITSQIQNKPNLPTHCFIPAQQGLDRDSLILLEQIRTIDKSRLRDYIGTLDYETMSEIDTALAISVGIGDF